MQNLEYRGYDSAGMAVLTDGCLQVRKDTGKIAEVESRLQLSQMRGQAGIAHTRWATHGGVTQPNSHPHVSADNRFAIVHNGIIENYLPLRQALQAQGYVFRSETDSEVIVHLIASHYAQGASVEEALIAATR
ncbi:MAG TPA: class II glutamine amidotransferase, partial [Candidatus Entotheonella sp.]